MTTQLRPSSDETSDSDTTTFSTLSSSLHSTQSPQVSLSYKPPETSGESNDVSATAASEKREKSTPETTDKMEIPTPVAAEKITERQIQKAVAEYSILKEEEELIKKELAELETGCCCFKFWHADKLKHKYYELKAKTAEVKKARARIYQEEDSKWSLTPL